MNSDFKAERPKITVSCNLAQDAPTFALFLHYNMAWGQPQQITVLVLGIYQTFKSEGAGQKKLAFIRFNVCRLCS